VEGKKERKGSMSTMSAVLARHKDGVPPDRSLTRRELLRGSSHKRGRLVTTFQESRKIMRCGLAACLNGKKASGRQSY